MARPKNLKQATIKKRRRWIGGLLLLAGGLLLTDYWAYPYGASPGGRTYNHGENGLWLRYTWAFGEKSDADVHDLAQRLVDRQIRYAYFHVRSVDRDGRLHYHHFDTTRRLVQTLHRLAPSVKILAWVYAGNRHGEGEVDLSNPNVRAQMASEAHWLTDACGFDGVQWDYEICADGDPDFVRLLQQTRAALPPGKLLGAATPNWGPILFRRWVWSDDYYVRVARECDQLAVMCYDTGFWLPRSYAWLVRQQAIHITQAVARGNSHCRLLLGVPTYGPGNASHNPRAENLAVALRGVREGLSNPQADLSVFAGIALFADYTTGAKDWEFYRRWWLTE